MFTDRQMARIERVKRDLIRDMQKSDERAQMVFEAIGDNIPHNGERLAALISIIVNELLLTPQEIRVEVTMAFTELVIVGVAPDAK